MDRTQGFAQGILGILHSRLRFCIKGLGTVEFLNRHWFCTGLGLALRFCTEVQVSHGELLCF